jgi:hypothetical protein
MKTGKNGNKVAFSDIEQTVRKALHKGTSDISMDYRMAFGKALNARKTGIEGLTKFSGEIKTTFMIPR